MYRVIKKEARRIDAFEKVTGRARFAADLNFTGQLYAQTVYSRFPHAKIIRVPFILLSGKAFVKNTRSQKIYGIKN